MKKHLLPKKTWLPLAATALMAVGCGLGISNVEFSAHEGDANTTMTVTTTWVSTDKDNAEGQHNPQSEYYLLYAMRVPADWSGEAMTAHVTNSTVDADVEMIDCPNYATYVNFFFPKEGYKWVAWQSKDVSVQGASATSTCTLKVGEAGGNYRLDIMAGAWKVSPDYLLNADGSINFDLTFGLNVNRDNWNEQNGQYWKQSEYLMLTTTIPVEEYKERQEAIAADASITATPTQDNGTVGATRPLWLDVANTTDNEVAKDLDMNFKVNGNGGIEGVAADAAEGAAEYFDFQGRKVANPNAGIYLVKRGNKVSKEVIR